MTIEERLEKIEKQNRKIKRWMAGVAAIALAALIGGTALSVRAYTAAIEPTSITTQAITLKDGSGRSRVILSGTSGVVYLYDTNGKARVTLGSGFVSVLDSNEVTRVRLYAADNKIHFYNASATTVAAHP